MVRAASYDFHRYPVPLWRKSAVHVLGGDPSGFWYDRDRPDGEHPALMATFFGEFDGQPLDAS